MSICVSVRIKFYELIWKKAIIWFAAIFLAVLVAEAAPGDNVALSTNGGTAMLSSTWSSAYTASECINNITNVAGDMCHTGANGGEYPWLNITLNDEYPIDRIEIFNRVGSPDNYNDRAENLWVMVSDTPFPNGIVAASLNTSKTQSVYKTQLSGVSSLYVLNVGDLKGKYIRIQSPGLTESIPGENFINLAEVKVFEGKLKVDLAIEKTVSNITPKVGDTVTFTLTVTNSGPDTAIDFNIEDILPSGFGGVSNISNGGNVNSSNEISWTIPSLAAGASMNVSFDVVVQ